jgi:PIN domain nuclease of toxin-antitoxin system
LFLDTSAILKLFLPERGSDVVRWLCSGTTKVQYELWCTASPRVRNEVLNKISAKRQSGQLSQHRADQIKATAKDMFAHSIHVRGDTPPPGLTGKDVTASDLVKRNNLTVGKNDWDMDHIEAIVNHLRFLGGMSKFQVVTADRGFAKILNLEGYGVINPETTTIEDLEKAWV